MRVLDWPGSRGADAGSVVAADRVVRRVAVTLAVIAVSLWLAGGLHLAGLVHGRGTPFDADHAGVAETLIGLVLAVATSTLWRRGSRARRIGLWATGFAIAGFCWGLTITSRGGHWPDITYHLAGLLLLITCFTAVLRAGRRSAVRAERR